MIAALDRLLLWKGPAIQWLEDNEEVIQRAYREMLEEEANASLTDPVFLSETEIVL